MCSFGSGIIFGNERNKVVIHTAMWMNLKNKLSEGSWTQKNTHVRNTIFHMNFRVYLSIFLRKPSGMLTGVELDLWVSLGSIAVLTEVFSSIILGASSPI